MPGPVDLLLVDQPQDAESARLALKLTASEARFRAIIENGWDSIVLLGADRSVAYVSPATVRILGCPEGEIIGHDALDFIHPDDRAAVARALALACETPAVGVVATARVRQKDGSFLHLEALFRSMLNDPAVGAIVANYRDISERVELQAQLQQAQKMETVGRLAGGVAHDFNNILMIINGTAELAIARLPPDDASMTDLLDIRRAGERAVGLTRQLLAFGRKQIVNPVVVDLREIVTDMSSMLRRTLGEDVDLVCDSGPSAACVNADRVQIEQVVLNLAVNARDAMPRGGTLTIDTRDAQPCEVRALAGAGVAEGPYVVLAVGDNGTGMDEATRAHIFEPFFTTKAPGTGTGLGLATVYSIVQQCGGGILMDTEVGHGTAFKIILPRVTAPPDVRQPDTAQAPAGHSETILVVEDEDGVRLLAQRMLESSGYTVLTARSGSDALQLLARHQGPVDLVVTDVVMPGMSGPDLARAVAHERPETRLLYSSGHTEDTLLRHSVLDHTVHFIAKPYSRRELTCIVRQILDAEADASLPAAP